MTRVLLIISEEKKNRNLHIVNGIDSRQKGSAVKKRNAGN